LPALREDLAPPPPTPSFPRDHALRPTMRRSSTLPAMPLGGSPSIPPPEADLELDFVHCSGQKTMHARRMTLKDHIHPEKVSTRSLTHTHIYI
jgi:hypothetical protein